MEQNAFLSPPVHPAPLPSQRVPAAPADRFPAEAAWFPRFPGERRPQGGASRRHEQRVRVPWGKRGSGCTLLYEALLLALVQGMPLREAGGILLRLDPRLWRSLPPAGERAERGGARAGEPALLSAYFDLETSYRVVVAGEDETLERGGVAERSAEVGRLFLIALIGAYLRRAVTPGAERVAGNSTAAHGRVSAEQAPLLPGQCRAPPG